MGMTGRDRTSVLIHRGSGTVRPLGDWNQKHGVSLLSLSKCHNYRGTRQACTPTCRLCEWNEKHQVGVPVPVTVAQVPLLGQHVAHRAGFQWRHLLLVESRFDVLEHLSFGSSTQYQLGSFDREWNVESSARRVEADRSPQFRIPKIGIVDSRGP